MKKIIDIQTKKEVIFSKTDVPMLIHGVEGSGASLFSMTVAAMLHKQGNKLIIYTAYPMAREEFMSQIIDVHGMFYLESVKDMVKALTFQTIFIQSGNMKLFKKIISKDSIIDRIIFVKNIDIIRSSLYKSITPFKFIIAGDLELARKNQEFKSAIYNTKILFSPLESEPSAVLEKYQACMRNGSQEKILKILED